MALRMMASLSLSEGTIGLAGWRLAVGIAASLAIGGIPGVLIAVYVVKALPLDVVRWVVVSVLLYTSVTLWHSSRRDEGVVR